MKKSRKYSYTVVGESDQIACFDRSIAKIVEKQVERYFEFFDTEKDVPVIFDIGANIGLFTIAALNRFPTATIVGYEISPLTYALYTVNTLPWHKQVQCTNVGLSDSEGEQTLYHYPLMPAISSTIKAPKIEKITSTVELLLSTTIDDFRYGRLINILPKQLKKRMIDSFVKRYFMNPIPLQVQTTTLSEQINRLGIDCIDMLKIDVEGAEERVLNGIEPQHWQMINQIAIEVHDIDNRLERIKSLLSSHNLTLQDERLEGFDMNQNQIFLLFGKRCFAH